MSWARYDDNLPMNKKWAKLRAHKVNGAAALGLHVLANTWSRHNGTAGVIEPHVPDHLVGACGTKLANLLVEVGMFEARQAGGWVIHDYADYHDPNDPNPDRSAADRQREVSEKRAHAGRKGGLAKAGKSVAIQEFATSNGLANPSPEPEPEPEPDIQKSSSSLTSVAPNRQTTTTDHRITEAIARHATIAALGKTKPIAYAATVRANDLAERGTDLQAYLNGNPTATVDDVQEVLTRWGTGRTAVQSEPKRDWYADPRCEHCDGDGLANTAPEGDAATYGPCHCRRAEPYPDQLATVTELRTA